MSDKLKQIQDVLGFHSSPSQNATDSNTTSAEPTSTVQATSPDVPLDADLEEEFQQHFTYHSFASHPLSKLSLVALGTAGVVGLLVLFYSLFQNPMGNLRTLDGAAKGSTDKKEELFAQEPEKREKEELLAQLALSQQAQQMKRYKSDKTTDVPKQPPPSLKEKPETPKAKTKERSVSPSSSRPTRAVARQPSRDLSTSSYNQRLYPINQSLANPKRMVSRLSSVRSIQPSSKAIDPQKQWQDLANLGSFKAKENNISASSPRPIPLVAETDDETAVGDSSTVLVSWQKVTSNHSYQDVPVQKLNGRIEGGLAVPANVSVSSGRNFEEILVSIVLNEPIKAQLSKLVVPSGARLTAMVKVNGPMISFVPRKLAFEIEGQYQEVELQPDAIAISGENGPVIAEVRTVGEDGGGLSVNQLGQLAGALGGLAGIEQATDFALIFNALGGRNDRRYRNNGIKLYTVNDGTTVTVRLTRPLVLPVPAPAPETAAPELDFE